MKKIFVAGLVLASLAISSFQKSSESVKPKAVSKIQYYVGGSCTYINDLGLPTFGSYCGPVSGNQCAGRKDCGPY